MRLSNLLEIAAHLKQNQSGWHSNHDFQREGWQVVLTGKRWRSERAMEGSGERNGSRLKRENTEIKLKKLKNSALYYGCQGIAQKDL
ncbi:hypothetical protein ACFX2G_005855 [Malus domestica]